jgi:hypothetical protein
VDRQFILEVVSLLTKPVDICQHGIENHFAVAEEILALWIPSIFPIYFDADDADIQSWYVERFLG